MLCSRGGEPMLARIGVRKALNRHGTGVQSRSQRYPLGQTEAQEGPMSVFIYADTIRQAGDPEHLKVFANQEAALAWFAENGVAFEYEVLE